MPIYRGPDGKIIEERTKRVRDEELTDLVTPPVIKAPSADNSDDATKIVNKQTAPQQVAGTPVAATPSSDADKTQLVGVAESSSASNDNVMADPTVGWLVVVNGPGTGQVLRLGYGSNSIGRGASDRVRLDFGDQKISRNEHSIITYDPRSRKFYIQHGRGNNLTYLEEKPVLVPTELTERSRLSIGETQLLFIPLCGEGFDWQDVSAYKSNGEV